jgi:murein DD-endopeptidase MepM/ murein hydrolase activator NlpD
MPAPVFPFALADANPLTLAGHDLDVQRHDELAAHVAAARGDAPACWGGYGEHRELYTGSELFAGEEPRVIHLGIDIWTDAGTAVAAPLDATVHSFADNDNFGDYGATIILQHDGFCTLYGHLARRSLAELHTGKAVPAGTVFAWLGERHENGGWPPHLHFQRILDMGDREGDFPGAATVADRNRWLALCPDPAELLV